MVRSCLSHIEYINGGECIQCDMHGIVTSTDCSTCKDFRLRKFEKPERPGGKVISRKPFRGTIGSRLAAIIERETLHSVSCSECDSEISRLNHISRDAVLSEIETIAENIVARGRTKAELWWQRVACSVVPDLIAERVRGWITEACCGPITEPNRGMWESSIRHLTYHIFPMLENDAWKWNIDQLAKRFGLFNGVRVCGIVFSDRSHDPDAVISYAESAGVTFDHFIIEPNRVGLREVVTWLPMLELLSPETAGTDEVVFSAHAKGVRHDDPDTMTRNWSDLMYQSCLDDWKTVHDHLSKHVATGSFRRFGDFPTEGNNRWHYSGTFFWWRLAEIGKRNWRKVDQRFFGTESWIGHQCLPEETGCLFLDDCGDPYSKQYWDEVVWPEWRKNHQVVGDINEMVSR